MTRTCGHVRRVELQLALHVHVEGVDAELTEIGGRDPPRHRRSRASPLRQWHAPRCVPLSLSGVKSPTRSSVRDGVPQPAPRSANLDSAFGGMQLFAPEAWRAAPLLLTHSAQMAQLTVRLPQL